MIQTVFSGTLLHSSRPGYPEGRTAPVPETVVFEWLDAVRAESVVSILCLLDDQHLAMYSHCAEGKGLLSAYTKAGFTVGHVPIADHKIPSVNEAEMAHVLALYDTLPKPVLIHCSAGRDRTGAVVERIQNACRDGSDKTGTGGPANKTPFTPSTVPCFR